MPDKFNTATSRIKYDMIAHIPDPEEFVPNFFNYIILWCKIRRERKHPASTRLAIAIVYVFLYKIRVLIFRVLIFESWRKGTPMRKSTLVFPLLFFLGIFSGVATAGPVPDTGQTTSYTDTFGEDHDYTINPPSYTKLGQNGVVLPNTATYADGWLMTRDNVTGLIWEMKTDDGSIHDKDNGYFWYDPNPGTNGGDPGKPGDGTDTKDFIDALNTSGFGGFENWRMPSRKELRSIVHCGTYDPSIDGVYFPNTVAGFYWSSTTSALYSYYAWSILFYNSRDDYCYKSYGCYVRAVRGGQ
jgi:hypothetical protein